MPIKGLNAPTRIIVQSTLETVDGLGFDNMCWQLVPTVDNSLTKEKLSNVQTAPMLEQFVPVTP